MILGPVRAGLAKQELTSNSFFLDDDMLRSHAISPEAITELSLGNYNSFLRLREEKLIEMESKFISAFGLNYQPSVIKMPRPSDQFELFE